MDFPCKFLFLRTKGADLYTFASELEPREGGGGSQVGLLNAGQLDDVVCRTLDTPSLPARPVGGGGVVAKPKSDWRDGEMPYLTFPSFGGFSPIIFSFLWFSFLGFYWSGDPFSDEREHIHPITEQVIYFTSFKFYHHAVLNIYRTIRRWFSENQAHSIAKEGSMHRKRQRAWRGGEGGGLCPVLPQPHIYIWAMQAARRKRGREDDGAEEGYAWEGDIERPWEEIEEDEVWLAAPHKRTPVTISPLHCAKCFLKVGSYRKNILRTKTLI